MGKRFKYKNESYLDSTGIMHDKELLSDILNTTKIIIGEEIATNEYINGKRVYKRMYEIGAMTGTVLSVAHGLTGYDLLWIDQSNTWLIAPDGAIGPLPFHNAHNANYAIEFYLSDAGKNIYFYSANQRISKAYVTLKYTKL